MKPDETRVVLRLGSKEMIDISVHRPTRSNWACTVVPTDVVDGWPIAGHVKA